MGPSLGGGTPHNLRGGWWVPPGKAGEESLRRVGEEGGSDGFRVRKGESKHPKQLRGRIPLCFCRRQPAGELISSIDAPGGQKWFSQNQPNISMTYHSDHK